MRISTITFAALGFVAVLGTRPCSAQTAASICDTESGTTRPRVNINYVPDTSANGKFVQERNSAAGTPAAALDFNFIDSGNGLEFIMPDVSVVEVNGWYYITGTSAGWKTPHAPPDQAHCAQYNFDPAGSNFAIYKTQNFRTYYFHAWAFPSTNWVPNQRIRDIGGRNFARLQSPQLFRKPYDLTRIYMVFHATEEDLVPENPAQWATPSVWPANPWARPITPNAALINTLWPDPALNGKYFDTASSEKYGASAYQPAYWSYTLCNQFDPAYAAKVAKLGEMEAQCDRYGSVFIVNTTTSAFETGASYVAFSNPDPSWFGYNDAGGTARVDGGVVAGHEVPSSGAAKIANPNTGLSPSAQLVMSGWTGMAYNGWGNIEWMYNDGFVFFDPNDGNQAYLYYGWAFMPSDLSANNWFGNHIAYHKLLNTTPMWQFDRTYRTHALAFDRNTNNPIAGQPNGLFDWQGTAVNFGTAEGCAVFYWPADQEGPGKYIALYTRNHWNSPAYQIVYRVGDSVAALGLGEGVYDGLSAAEEVLLASDTPTSSWGHSYGHVDVFWVNWPKEVGSGTKRQPYLAFHAKETQTDNRHPFFKELKWDAAQNKLVRLYQNGTGHTAYQDVTRFLIPRCGP